MDSDQVFDHRKFDGGALQGGTAPTKTPRDCIHGRLARSCEQCEAEREIADLERELAAARAALSLPETVGEPVAYLYTLEYGSAVANRMVSIEKLNYPFGVCGSDYLAKNDKGVSYVRQTPLYAAPPSQPAQGWKLVPEEPPLVCLRHGMADITPPCRKWCGSASCTPPTQAKPTNGEGA